MIQDFNLDLKGFFIELLIRWKVIICFGILFALVGCIYAKNSFYESVEANLILAEGLDSYTESIKKELSSSDISYIEGVVATAAGLEHLEFYRGNLPIMMVDPLEGKVLVIKCTFDDAISSDESATFILGLYENYVNSNEFCSLLGEKIGLSDDERYGLESLISTDNSLSTSSSIVTVGSVTTTQTVIPDYYGVVPSLDISIVCTTDNSERLLSAVIEILDEVKFSDVKKNGDISYDCYILKDSVTKIAEMQNQINASINMYTTTLNNDLPKLKDTRLTYFVCRSMQEGVNVDSYLKKLGINSPINESSFINASQIVTAGAPSYKKYIVLGFLLGVFVFVFCYFGIEIIVPKSGRIWGRGKSSDDRLLGTIYCKSGRYKNKFVFSPLAINVLDKNFKKTDAAMDNLVASIKWHLKQSDNKTITILYVGLLDKKQEDIESQINKIVCKLNEDVELANYTSISSCLSDEASMYNMLDNVKETVAFVEVYGQTKFTDIYKIKNLLSEKNVQIIGTIAVE